MLLVTSFGVTQVKENLTELKKEQGEILIQKFLVSTWLCELAIFHKKITNLAIFLNLYDNFGLWV